ncbi:hypothetical protein SAMN03159408_07202, partial [Burkholderia sp. NFPP32]
MRQQNQHRETVGPSRLRCFFGAMPFYHIPPQYLSAHRARLQSPYGLLA